MTRRRKRSIKMRASFIAFAVVFSASRATKTTAEMDDFKRRLETRMRGVREEGVDDYDEQLNLRF